MRFQSTYMRNFWLTYAGSWLFDAVLSFVLAKEFFDDFWPPFLIIFAFLTFWPAIYAFRSAIYNIIVNWFTRKAAIAELKSEFRKNQLPNKNEAFADAPYYFNSVLTTVGAPEKAKLYSAMILGQLMVIQRYSAVDNLRFNSRLEQALSEYSDALDREEMRPSEMLA